LNCSTNGESRSTSADIAFGFAFEKVRIASSTC